MEKKVIRGKDKIPAPDIYVSCDELDVGEEVIKNLIGEKGIEWALVNLWGFDPHVILESGKFYEVEQREFRKRTTGEIIKGERYVGKERLDDIWILQGNPSQEAKDASRQDKSYLSEIRNISRRRNVS